jgi:hypothetical protein
MYFLVIYKTLHNTLSGKTIRILIIATATILTFAYNTFSHDLFNYMFDARIITHYGQNPYEHKALDYPHDDWIRFMQWTHRTYPYGPVWLALTVVLSVLGVGKLLSTFFLFKLMFAINYLACCYLLYKILQYLTTRRALIKTAIVVCALHPLILIEALLSPHIDAVMATFALAGIYYLFKAKTEIKNYRSNTISAIFAFFISVGIKFATIILIPAVFFMLNKSNKKAFILSVILLCTAATFAQGVNRTLQPWYFTLPLALLPLLAPYVRIRYLLILALLCVLPLLSYWQLIFLGISKGILDIQIF